MESIFFINIQGMQNKPFDIYIVDNTQQYPVKKIVVNVESLTISEIQTILYVSINSYV